jgi:hypothetical protein
MRRGSTRNFEAELKCEHAERTKAAKAYTKAESLPGVERPVHWNVRVRAVLLSSSVIAGGQQSADRTATWSPKHIVTIWRRVTSCSAVGGAVRAPLTPAATLWDAAAPAAAAAAAAPSSPAAAPASGAVGGGGGGGGGEGMLLDTMDSSCSRSAHASFMALRLRQ